MKIAQNLRTKINSGQVTTGILVTFHLWSELVEILYNAGYDYMIVDLEHGAFRADQVAEICALGRLIGFPVIIRPPSTDYQTIRTSLDRGPCGLLLPCVESAQIMDHVQASVFMPPRGKRRPGGAGNRWLSDYQYTTWKRDFEDDFIVLPQIESSQGLEHVGDIASHTLTTAMAVGPYDLSADLGVCYQPDHPLFIEAIATIRTAAQEAGKNMWMIGDAQALRSQEFTFICVGEATAIFEQAAQKINREAKNTL